MALHMMTGFPGMDIMHGNMKQLTDKNDASL